ncbi:MAG: DUF202 domain-containing protein [Flammeovirgaceae bacterium]|nr:DUF202 domain-containing protein [Flammeovirgaceae bacterium]
MEKKPPSATDHLANERTFLAWIRTSNAIMAFGFVVVKFALFVKQIGLVIAENTNTLPNRGYSAILGIVLVGIGILMALLSYYRYKRWLFVIFPRKGWQNNSKPRRPALRGATRAMMFR